MRKSSWPRFNSSDRILLVLARLLIFERTYKYAVKGAVIEEQRRAKIQPLRLVVPRVKKLISCALAEGEKLVPSDAVRRGEKAQKSGPKQPSSVPPEHPWSSFRGSWALCPSLDGSEMFGGGERKGRQHTLSFQEGFFNVDFGGGFYIWLTIVTTLFVIIQNQDPKNPNRRSFGRKFIKPISGNFNGNVCSLIP